MMKGPQSRRVDRGQERGRSVGLTRKEARGAVSERGSVRH